MVIVSCILYLFIIMNTYNQITANKRRTVWLITIFISLIIFIGYALGTYFDVGYFGVGVAVLFSLIMTSVSYFSGDKIALATAGAQGPIKKNDNPYVYRLVENLCLTAGLPLPKIYIIPDQSLNAFATGRDPGHSSIALTIGLIESLENEELEAVIAHELSHIKNYDIRVMMIVIVLVGVVTLLADFFLRFGLFRGGRREGNVGGIIVVVGLILAILSPLFAKLIQLAVSRRREFLADASGVLLTRYPDALISALKKISQRPTVARSNRATAHLYIYNPFRGKKVSRLFSTHPPIEERVKALEAMR